MTRCFQLECPRCRRPHRVDRGQAGQTLPCPCGGQIDVPTLRGLEMLPAVADQPAPTPAWAGRQQLVFLGLVALAAGAVLAAGVWRWLPLPPAAFITAEAIDREVSALSPIRTLILWEMLLEGVHRRPTEVEKAYERSLAAARRWWIVAGLLAAGGAAAIAAGAAFRPTNRRSDRA